ncbi:acyl carrier protein [Shewanella sp. KX20019]|uniref:acyl carrier protein n=1 Tax=Shewanella sp. KX20019 TaxID=2803864 RepID=UPI001926C79F|nr:acyl carrier protein [Shewanella sp. KX20019]QQX80333.1 acyl carrier protein [Shewanella sp. KX20019]
MKFCKQTLTKAISQYLSEVIEEFSAELHLDTSFSRLGLDSTGHVQLSAIIEDHIQVEIEPTIAFDYPTINSLIQFLEKKSVQAVEVA